MRLNVVAVAVTSIASAVLIPACIKVVDTTIARAHIGTRYARLTGYFGTRAAAPGGRHEEVTPADIRHDALLDEATLVALSATESCFDVVVRTDSGHDEPLEQLAPRCELDDGERGELRGVVDRESVAVHDHSFVGQREVVAIEGIAASSYLGMSVSQPEERVFRVIERRGRVCCPGGGRQVALNLTSPSWDVADYHYQVQFAWTVQ
jgi:hypothetical protein